MQTEAARQFYLGVAGVRVWYARESLPGAAPSPEYDFSELEDQPVAPVIDVAAPVAQVQRDPEQTARSRDKIAHLQSLMSAVEAPSKAPRQVAYPEPEPKAKAPVAEEEAIPGVSASEKEEAVVAVPTAGEVPRLFVRAWQGSRFLLVAEMSEEASLALQETLATNILKSLGDASSAELGAIQWPLFNNLKVSLNRIEHLVEAIAAQYGSVGERQVIVLGKGGDLLEQAFGRAPAVRFSGNLAKLASDAQLKRELWHMIKPLAAI
ncbi:hypothetical protein [Marinobacter sp.]|uniref:hypothetical protein n=1 Tax=Marinobacter sp. TaxID=50741 RepID=UPI002B2766AB|nr:hypothetical protein [Marinobacter sp.]